MALTDKQLYTTWMEDPAYRARRVAETERYRAKLKAEGRYTAARRREAHGTRCKKYGLSRDDYDRMIQQSAGRCAICERPMMPACIDHCHATGRVRGLICDNCNVGLGRFGDDATLLQRASDYLGL